MIDEVITAGRFTLRRVHPDDEAMIAAVEESAQPWEDTFRYFRTSPMPVADFLTADHERTMFALCDGSTIVGSTTLSPFRPGEPTMGFTWLSPEFRGTGANRAMKQALFGALRQSGYTAVWFRADVDNEISRHSMEANGAVFSHLEEDPRAYPDGHVSDFAYYRREL